MQIREGVVDDVLAITTLFSETIRSVNTADYSPEQVEAWASGSQNISAWTQKIIEQTFYLATEAEQLIGFGSISESGYLDFLFVHKDEQRKGVAERLLEAIEQKALAQSNFEITVHASVTAEGFFRKKGFVLIEKVQKMSNGVGFENNFMRKVL